MQVVKNSFQADTWKRAQPCRNQFENTVTVILVTDFGVGDIFWMLVPVTNILQLSPTHFVSNIRHRYRRIREHFSNSTFDHFENQPQE